MHKKPVLLDCNFIVDPTNGNGLGIRSLKGPGIANVFMHTSASFVGDTHSTTVIDGISDTSNLVVGMPISGSGIAAGTVILSITSSTAIVINPAATATAAAVTISYAGVGSPNPASGLILVQFQDNFNRYLLGNSGVVSPLSGTPISISGSGVMTVGRAYVVTSVGTSTQANWAAMGLPSGVIPAVGETFIAKATGSGTGTGVVQAAIPSGVGSIELVGDANTTLGANYNGAAILGGSAGSYMILQCLGTSFTLAAPVAGTTIGLSFYLSNSYITVQGE
jgi:hypothetical protein